MQEAGRPAESFTSDSADRLRALVRAHPLLCHPFFSPDGAGIGETELRAWLGQQYFMSVSLAPCFAALYAGAALFDWRPRSRLLELAKEEDWDSGGHSRAFVELLGALGISVATVAASAPLPHTVAAAQARLALCSGRTAHDLAVGALALAYANEFANRYLFAGIFKSIRRPLKDKIPKEYFLSHLRDEVEHGNILVEFAFAMNDGRIRYDEVAGAVKKLLDSRREFLDGLLPGSPRMAVAVG